MQLTRQMMEGLSALGTAPELGFSAVHAALHFAVTTVPRLSEADENDLAAELAEHCVNLVGVASRTDFGAANSLKITKGCYFVGLRLPDATDTRVKALLNEAPSHPDMDLQGTLANALDTLDTIRAQPGDTTAVTDRA